MSSGEHRLRLREWSGQLMRSASERRGTVDKSDFCACVTGQLCDAVGVAITRLWRDWTLRENADDYERFLLEELFPSMRDIPGFLSADLLRRPEEAEMAFACLAREGVVAAFGVGLRDVHAGAVVPGDAPAVAAARAAREASADRD